MVHRFRVEGASYSNTYLPQQPQQRPFDETYELAGEHPAEALEKLLHEIEWGILDSEQEFTISYLGSD